MNKSIAALALALFLISPASANTEQTVTASAIATQEIASHCNGRVKTQAPIKPAKVEIEDKLSDASPFQTLRVVKDPRKTKLAKSQSAPES